MFINPTFGQVLKRQRYDAITNSSTSEINNNTNRNVAFTDTANEEINLTMVVKAYSDDLRLNNDIRRHDFVFSCNFSQNDKKTTTPVLGMTLYAANYLLHKMTLAHEANAASPEINLKWIQSYLSYNGVCLSDPVDDDADDEVERSITYATRSVGFVPNVFCHGGKATSKRRLFFLIKEECVQVSQTYRPSSLSQSTETLATPKDGHVFRIIPVVTSDRHIAIRDVNNNKPQLYYEKKYATGIVTKHYGCAIPVGFVDKNTNANDTVDPDVRFDGLKYRLAKRMVIEIVDV
jgi:hypothetical protein